MLGQSSQKPLFSIGIDLGTTTCALSYVNLKEGSSRQVQTLLIHQWKEDGLQCAQELLPSYAYIPLKHQIKNNHYGTDLVVGLLAKNKRFAYESRVIHSAKSWLCADGVDVSAKFLPWHSDEVMGAERFSPVEISAHYLSYLKKSWNDHFKDSLETHHFDLQSIVITVPASFDEVATKLTLEAARLADFPMASTSLLEEPQAGCYGFFQEEFEKQNKHQDIFASGFEKVLNDAGSSLSETKHLLVCDVGGGTTDFSLFCFNRLSEKKELKRIASGKHVLLGGDNIDLKIAHILEAKFEQVYQKKLSSKQWLLLCSLAKDLKEQAFDGSEEKLLEIALPSSGSNLFEELMVLKVSSLELINTVLDGFFPLISRQEKLLIAEEPIREIGLSYAFDPRITAHMVDFLRNTSADFSDLKIDALLFIGGSLSPDRLRERLKDQIVSLQEKPVCVLGAPSIELAVSKGAAIYGASLHLGKERIRSGYPRSLFLEIAHPNRANHLLCLVSKGSEEIGLSSLHVEGLEVLTDQVVQFALFSSESSSKWPKGQLIAPDQIKAELGDLKPLPYLKTFLKRGKKEQLPCHLEMQITGSGGFFLDCVSSADRWPLEFKLEKRAFLSGGSVFGLETQEEKQVFEKHKTQLIQAFDLFYGKPADDPTAQKPNQLVKILEQILGQDKKSWTFHTLRGLWDILKKGETKRIRSEQHEKVWLSLTGFLLRPGIGDVLDPVRLEELIRIMNRGLCFPLASDHTVQSYILWRRVAPGLASEQQEILFNKILPSIRNGQAHPEMLLLAAGLERVDIKKKAQLGRLIFQHLLKPKPAYPEQHLLALTRISTRQPVYTGLQAVLPAQVITEWVIGLLDKGQSLPSKSLVLFFAQSGRIIGLRELEIASDLRDRIKKLFLSWKVDEAKIALLEKLQPAAFGELSELLADDLPCGFILSAP